ncbi:MAG: calcium-binding protein [Pseudomonadota bacterium]
MAIYLRTDLLFPGAASWLNDLNWAATDTSDTQFRLTAADGSVTIVSGTGFTFNGDQPTGGTVTAISHRLADGVTVIETLTGLGLGLVAFETAMDQDTLPASLYAGNDTLTGGLQGDLLSGLAGHDSLSGLRGNDTLLGGLGNDNLGGGQGSDSLNGGAGTDAAVYNFDGLSYSNPPATGVFDFSRLGIDPSVIINDGMGGNDTLVGIERVIFLGDHISGDRVIGSKGADLISTAGWIDGGAGNDTLTGYEFSDTIYGGAGNDLINGNSTGDSDLIGLRFAASANVNFSGVVFLPSFTLTVAGFGTDTLLAMDGFELTGSGAADTLIASVGNDILFGGAGGDNLQGGLGDDTIGIDAGSDTVSGGAGNDVIRADYSASNVGIALDFQNFAADASFTLAGDGFGGTDSFTGMNRLDLRLTTGSDTVTGSAGNDSIDGRGGNDRLNGGDGNDTLYGNTGRDTIYGGAGIDQIYGFSGNDQLYADAGAATIVGGADNDLITGSDDADRLFGDADNPFGPGGIGTGRDTINGGAGNDLIWAGRGADKVYGGDGDDRIGGGEGGGFDGTPFPVNFEILYDTGNDTVDGGAGNDAFVRGFDPNAADKPVRYIFAGLESVSTFFVGGVASGSTIRVETLALSLTNGNDTVTAGDGQNKIYGLGGNDRLQGGAGFDLLQGGSGNDTLYGMGGSDSLQGSGEATIDSDVLYGGEGDDTLNAGVGGNDSVFGGNGSDQAVFDYSTIASQPILLSLAGVDPAHGQTVADGLGGSLTINGVENFRIIGNTSNDTLTGADVRTVLEGFRGADSLIGGAAGDLIYGDSDSGYHNPLPPIDTSNDTLIGNGGSDYLFGGAGNDSLFGGADADNLYGGAGNDTLQGGDGDDYFFDAEGSNLLNGEAGNDRIYGGGIGDSTLIGDDGNDQLTGGVGNDSVYGGEGNDTFSLDAGNDQLFGGAGRDLFVLYLTPTAGAGTVFSANSIGAFFGTNESAVYVVSLPGMGTDTISGMNGMQIFGTSFADDITGSGGGDFIFDYGGQNTLRGDNGDDTIRGAGLLYGGAGNDLFTDPLAAATTIDGGAGNDVVSYLADFDFSDFSGRVFDASGLGPGVVVGVVDDLVAGVASSHSFRNIEAVVVNTWFGDDSIIGSGGGDLIQQSYGGANFFGGDTLIGGGGNDTIQGSTANDSIYGGAGIDTYDLSFLVDGFAVNLAQAGTQTSGIVTGVDRLTSIESVWGGAANDTLTGNSGKNELRGNAGNDVLVGGAGADRLDGGAGFDTADYSASSAITVSLATPANNTGVATGDVFVSIEALLSGAGADNLTGNNLQNRLDGGSGNDTLMGLGGADDFIYHAGADRITDFTDNLDALVLDRDLWGGGVRTEAQIVALAVVTAGNTVFDFGGGNILTVVGVTNPNLLLNDISFIL